VGYRVNLSDAYGTSVYWLIKVWLEFLSVTADPTPTIVYSNVRKLLQDDVKRRSLIHSDASILKLKYYQT